MNQSNHTLINAIDVTLPQTQCELCTYPSCRSYAEAIVIKGERIDRCEPGGVETLVVIANITKQDSTPFISDMEKKTKSMTLAVIREEECIGCTKCIQACPVDAIVGSGKQMHTVITDACNGCELCLPPCPVDCIDRLPHPKYNSALEINQQSYQRFKKRNRRLSTKKQRKRTPKKGSVDERKVAIREAIARKKRHPREPDVIPA